MARAFVKTIIHDGDQAFSDSYRERATKGVGYKQFHNCRIDPSCCKKKVYILNHKNKESCSVWFSNVEHNHRETIIEQKAPKNNNIHISISTLYLLLLAKKRKHICSDATHKLNYKRKLSLIN